MTILSPAQITTDINASWPDNISNSITPAILRSTVLEIVNSYFNLTGVLPRSNGGGAASIPGEQAALGVGVLAYALVGANFNSIADQPIPIILPTGATRYRMQGIFISNPSVSLTTAVGGVYTAPAKGGIAMVSAGQAYAALTTNAAGVSGSLLVTAILNMNTAFYNAASLYLSLTTPQGAPATADIVVYVQPLP